MREHLDDSYVDKMNVGYTCGNGPPFNSAGHNVSSLQSYKPTGKHVLRGSQALTPFMHASVKLSAVKLPRWLELFANLLV